MSADEVTTIAFFPLVSASRCNDGRQSRNCRAVTCAPVSTTMATSGWVISRRPASPSGQATYCNTSGGTPARQHCSASRYAVRGVCGAGLSTTALPAISAANTPPAGIAYGKFHGGATTTTPRGRWFTDSSACAA